MRCLDSYDTLIEYLDSDVRRADINPVRFINVETMRMWVRIKSYLTGIVRDVIKLSDFCENDDIAPNLNRLKNKLRNLPDSALVVPISEYLRINRPIATKTLSDVLHISYANNEDGKLRVYVLLYRMKDVISSLPLDPRNQNAVAAVVENTESDYSLTIVQKGLHFAGYVDGFKKYFIYWEQNPDKPIILKTGIAINYSDIVFSDNVEVIITPYDLLRHFGLPSVFPNDAETNSQWERLVFDFSGRKNFDTTASSILQVPQYSDTLFERWGVMNAYERWILWLWARIKTKDTYLQAVFEKSKVIDDFEECLYGEIAEYVDSAQYNDLYAQRKELLRKTGIVPSLQWFRFKPGMPVTSKLKCFTDITKEERIEVINLASEIPEWSQFLKIIRNIYPSLWAYLQPCKIENPRMAAYFDTYKKCKVINCVTDEMMSLMSKFAEERCKSIWKLKSRNSLVDHYYCDGATVLFVDALGIEYHNVIIDCFSGDEYDVESEYGYCNLPSTTEYNNDFYESRRHLTPFYELDRWKHSPCSYPESIVRELDIVQELKNTVDNALKANECVIIAADHGTSRMAVLAKGKSHEASEVAQKYKYGRYCIDEVANYSDISGCIQYDSFWIFANYDKFSQKGTPICETHGGASLEEMIVPVIRIKHKSTKNRDILQQPITPKICLLTPVVKLPVSKEVVIRFSCEEPLYNVTIHVDGKEFQCTRDDGDYAFTHFIDSSKSQYIAKIISGGIVIGELKYKVTRPVEKRDKFDI